MKWSQSLDLSQLGARKGEPATLQQPLSDQTLNYLQRALAGTDKISRVTNDSILTAMPPSCSRIHVTLRKFIWRVVDLPESKCRGGRPIPAQNIKPFGRLFYTRYMTLWNPP
jgi:hypothetical protein